MRVITLDFESFFGDDYTLSKMTTEAYVRDARFESHGASIKWSEDHHPQWYTHADLIRLFQNEDLSDCGVVMHHAQFDGLILSHHYNIRPKFIFDTLSMARLLIGNHLSVSLESLAKHFGLSAKTVPYQLFKGRHWNELAPAVQQQVADGANHDVDLTWSIFKILAAQMPAEEFEVIDSVVRMFTEPALIGDTNVLANLWEKEAVRKQTAMASLNVTDAQLQSSNQFADLLRAEGIEPETKEGKNGPIYAFAKTDDFMRDFLLEHENERVRTLAEARLGVKSSLLQTRAETLGWMAHRGPMPVYIRYSGAGTLRFSGGDGANWQNFKRGSDIRRAICAPEGYLLAPVDLSQVECRVLAYLARQEDQLEQFRNGEDPYVDIASKFYARPITKDDKAERGTGKQAILSCGYGSAGPKFRATAKLGIYGPPVLLELEDANRFVHLYRDTHARVIDYWRDCEMTLKRMHNWLSFDWGILKVVCDADKGTRRIYFPNGCFIIYDSLELHAPTPEEIEKNPDRNRSYFRIKTRYGWKAIYGSMLAQNMCEAVSRIIMTQAMIRIKQAGLRPVNSTHDELLILIPKDGREQNALQFCIQEMTREPAWLPGIPLEAEGSLSERYDK